MFNFKRVNTILFIFYSASIISIPNAAHAQCKQWRDNQGTSHTYCKFGRQIDYQRRFRNGTRTKELCYEYASQTDCNYYTNGMRVETCTYSSFGTRCRQVNSSLQLPALPSLPPLPSLPSLGL